MRLIKRLLILMFFGSSLVLGGDGGTFSFLRNDVSPRFAGVGGRSVTMTDDPTAIFYNPAAIATLAGQRYSVGFFKHLLDVNSGYASFGKQITTLGFVGAGIQYINYGKFDGRGPEGQDIGSFGAGELALTVGYASELEGGLHYGVSAKYIYSSIASYSASGAALDLGVQYIAVPNRVLLGASLNNLGTQFSPYMNTHENLPLDLTLGASIYPEHLPAVLTVSFHKVNESQDSFAGRLKSFSIGAELSPAPNIQLRIGYNNEQRQELKLGSSSGFAGISVGGGISSGEYTVDYSFSSFGTIGAVHRVSVTF